MEFKKQNNTYFIRLEKGEEVVETLKTFVEKENISAGSLEGIGALSEVTLGVFYPATKEYKERKMTGIFEITSLLGNISQKEGAPYLHLHITVADEKNQVFGGHLVSAKISATGEILARSVETKISRKMSNEIGLNLFEF